MRIPLTIVSLAVCAASSPAQEDRVFPGPARFTDGDTLSASPFGYTEIRTQQVWRGDAITNSVGVILEMAMRPDISTQNEPGRSYSNFTIAMGYSAKSPDNLDTTFANNVQGSLTTVFSGPYVLPSQGTFSDPGPFNIRWMLSTPFFYDKVNGNLLVEIVGVNMMGKSNYFVDASTAGGSGAFGTSGPISTGDNLRLLADPSSVPDLGGQLIFRGETDLASYPSVLLLGDSGVQYGAVPLPFDLGAVGAPGNSLYTNVIGAVGWTLAPQAPMGYAASLTLPVPNDPTISGLSLYGQCTAVHLPSNNLGVVTSNGVEFKLGATGPISGEVLSYIPTNPTGNLQRGGPVVMFRGFF